MEREEAQRKVAEELEAAGKLREDQAAREREEMEEAKRVVQKEKERLRKEKENSKEKSAYDEQSEGPEVRIPVINVVPIMMVTPDEVPMQGTSGFPKAPAPAHATKRDPKEMWEEILKEHGKKPKPYSRAGK